MGHGGIKLILHDLKLRFLLMQQLGQLLILSEQIGILPEHNLHPFLQLPNLLTLSLQNRILLLQQVEVLSQEFFDLVGMLFQFGVQDVSSWALVEAAVISSH